MAFILSNALKPSRGLFRPVMLPILFQPYSVPMRYASVHPPAGFPPRRSSFLTQSRISPFTEEFDLFFLSRKITLNFLSVKAVCIRNAANRSS